MTFFLVILSAVVGFICGDGADGSFRSLVSGTVYVSSGSKNKVSPLENANVMLVSGKDTLYTVSDGNGRYRLSLDQTFEIELQISYVGYETHRCRYQLDHDRTEIAVELIPVSEELKAAGIKDEIPLFTTVEDTVLVNAAALDRMDGDRAVELLKQIPGFEVKDGGITVWGEPVQKTYVNGKLLFGDNAMSAVQLLGADEVKTIRVYDQQSALDRHRGLKHSRKERVLDIVTFSSFLKSVDLVAQLRGGADGAEASDGGLNSRYACGTDANFNSEMTQMSLRLNGNNICDASNAFEVITGTAPVLTTDRLHKSADMSLTRKWKDAEWGNSINASYAYQSDLSRSASRRAIDRIMSDGNAGDMHYEESRQNDVSEGIHVVSVGAGFKDTPIKSFGMGLGLEIDDNVSDFLEKMSQSSETTGLLSQSQLRSTMNRGFSITPSLDWSDPDCKGGWMPSCRFHATLGRHSGSDNTLDTLSSSFYRRYLTGESASGFKECFGTMQLKKVLIDNPIYSIEIEPSFQAQYICNQLEKYTFDRQRSQAFFSDSLDVSNSCHYSWNVFSAGPYLTINVNSRNMHFYLLTGLNRSQQIDEELFPAEFSTDKSYIMLGNTIASFRYYKDNRRFTTYYQIKGNIPSIEQSRKQVNNSNPIRIRVGNPDLTPNYSGEFCVVYSIGPRKDGSSFEASTKLNRVRNAIIGKISYFPSESSLEIWGQDYQIPAGTTLETYENASGEFKSSSRLSYSRRVKPLRGTLNATAAFVIQKTPQYDGETLNSIRGISPSMTLSLSCMPVSKYLRIIVLNSFSSIQEKNNGGQILSEGFMDTISASAEIRFFKDAFADVNYNCIMYRFREGFGMDTDIQNLNFAIGYRLLKGNLGLSLSGNDMLDRASNYSTSATSSEFIQNWNTSFGRYYLLNLAYRFGKRN